jgi:DNA-binding response OmpR family regulator
MERILLIEDEEQVANLIAIFLRRKGLLVDVVYNLAEGMKKFSSEHRIVLLDILLGAEKSFPLLKKIKQESPQTTVIVISAHDNDENVMEAKRLGADGFIVKPILNENLEKILFSKINPLRRENKD